MFRAPIHTCSSGLQNKLFTPLPSTPLSHPDGLSQLSGIAEYFCGWVLLFFDSFGKITTRIIWEYMCWEGFVCCFTWVRQTMDVRKCNDDDDKDVKFYSPFPSNPSECGQPHNYTIVVIFSKLKRMCIYLRVVAVVVVDLVQITIQMQSRPTICGQVLYLYIFRV